MVDSGWKTVNAVVTDTNGDTAQASTKFYVLLNVGDVDHQMRGGETYRVYGCLMPAPKCTIFQIGEYGPMQGPSTRTFVLVDLGATVLLNAETYEEVDRWMPEATAGGRRHSSPTRHSSLSGIPSEQILKGGETPDFAGLTEAAGLTDEAGTPADAQVSEETVTVSARRLCWLNWSGL